MVCEGLRAQDLVRQARQVGLLPGDAVEVTTGEIVALPDEAQGVLAIEGLPARREVRTGQRLVDRVVEADVHAADGVSQHLEPQETDFGIVVNGDAGEVADGVDEGLSAGLGGLLVDGLLVRLPALGGGLLLEFVLLHELRSAVDTVELGVAQLVATVDVTVARQGDCGGGGAVIGDPDEDHRVGAGGVRLTGTQHVDLLLGQRVALGVGPRVNTDEEDIGGAVLLVAEVETPGLVDVAVEPADGGIGVAAGHEQEDRDDREDDLDRGGAELAVDEGGTVPGDGAGGAGARGATVRRGGTVPGAPVAPGRARAPLIVGVAGITGAPGVAASGGVAHRSPFGSGHGSGQTLLADGANATTAAVSFTCENHRNWRDRSGRAGTCGPRRRATDPPRTRPHRG